MRNFFVLIAGSGVLLSAAAGAADVDVRPLNVTVAPAFPKLIWPDWLTGTDQGLRRNPLPILLTGDGSDNRRLFVATQYGSVHLLANDPKTTELATFLDVRDRVHYDSNENEEGFLGFAFHPQFAENGYFFVFYTARRAAGQVDRRSILSRFHVLPGNRDQADPRSEEVLLEIPQAAWNHNGGTVVFGPDGYLYIAVGDGGHGNDPYMNGQNLQTLHGSVLRIDVDRRDDDLPYAIPPDNPFAGQPKFARGEIWAYGLRNVWRLSFDRQTGTCWGADVGQKDWEEINIIRRGGNYGWNLREGKHAFGPGGVGPREGLIEPIWEYGRELGKSIIGGCAYHGASAPQLEGAYLYADYITGRVWALWYDASSGQVTANRPILDQGPAIITFGEDSAGEVYFTTVEGGIYKFAPQTCRGVP